MSWGWLLFLIYLLGVVVIASNPQALRTHSPAAALGIASGCAVEFGLRDARPLWDGAQLLLPVGGVELIYLLGYYGVQGLMLYQFMPKQTSLQLPYTSALALGTAGLEVLLSVEPLGMLAGTGWRAFITSFTVHFFRLGALMAWYYALNYEERAEELQERRQADQRVRRSLQMWQFTWPSLAMAAFGMLRLTQRMASPRRHRG